MSGNTPSCVFIGFGEAAMAFADGVSGARAYDRKTYVGQTRLAKLAEYRRCGVAGCDTNKAAVSGAPLILSLVTADKALDAARETARSIAPGVLFCDMNSVAPRTKRDAALAIEAAGGHYADVAVMAPVHPAGRAVPLLVSGPHAERTAAALVAIGFGKVRCVGGAVGDASAIKMIRSVMVKGLEGLTAECALAADRAGIAAEVFASLDASWPGTDWAAKVDYNLGRMIEHGLRRADEMDEVVKTLDALGTGSMMSQATAERQRAIGRLALGSGGSLEDKLAAILHPGRKDAA